MSYFSNFPTVAYSIDGINQKVVVDIMRGFRFSDYATENQKSFLDYRIPEGQRPEMLSHGVYDRSDLNWVPLLFNNIQDPFYDWPSSSTELENLIDVSYPGKAFFVDVSLAKVYDGETLSPKNQSFDTRIPHFEPGSKVERVVVTQKGQSYSVTVEENSPVGEVMSWDPSFMKMVVKPVSGAWNLVGEAKRVSDLCSAGMCEPVVVNNLSYDLRVTNSRGEQILCPLVRITDENKNSIHHFESEYGQVISPMQDVRPDAINSIPRKDSTLIYGYVMKNVESFDLSASGIGRVSIVTNFQFEERQNDMKRDIKMMRPELLTSAIKQMRNVLSGA